MCNKMPQRHVLYVFGLTLYMVTNVNGVQKRGLLPNDIHLFQELKDKLTALEIRLGSSVDGCNGKGIHLNEFGTTYTRWGRTKCPDNNTELVYSGYVGGSWYEHKGAAANYLCMPSNPDSNYKYQDGVSENRGYVYGAEYKTWYNHVDVGRSQNNYDVPCAVCRAVGSASVLMIPGKTTCAKSWTTQYTGNLMSGRYDNQAATEYICVDREAEVIPASSAIDNGVLMYPVEARCGSLKCPPYVNGREFACVVCSR